MSLRVMPLRERLLQEKAVIDLIDFRREAERKSEVGWLIEQRILRRHFEELKIVEMAAPRSNQLVRICMCALILVCVGGRAIGAFR